MDTFIDRFKPESAYFRALNGKRSMQFVINLADPSDIPSIAEPFFFGLDADVEATPVMNADDLRKGLQKIMK